MRKNKCKSIHEKYLHAYTFALILLCLYFHLFFRHILSRLFFRAYSFALILSLTRVFFCAYSFARILSRSFFLSNSFIYSFAAILLCSFFTRILSRSFFCVYSFTYSFAYFMLILSSILSLILSLILSIN